MFSIVVAYCKNRGIGLDNNLPWPRLKQDMKFFQDLTTKTKSEGKKNAIIMGRKTWESIGSKPLQGRVNIIISRTKKYKGDFHGTFDCIDNALEYCKNKPEIENTFVIGGSSIYEHAIKKKECQRLYVTYINGELECDRFFPVINNDFSLRGCSETVDDTIGYNLLVYNRTNNSHGEFEYLSLLQNVLNTGVKRETRSGDTLSIFGARMEFDISNNVPLLTTKKMAWKTCIKELLWFIRGETDNKTLQNEGVHIWDGNSSREYLDSIGLTDREQGDLGPVYGFQWRHFGAEYKDCHTDYEGKGYDQFMECINLIKTDPTSRRIIMSAWNPPAMKEMALPPCHMFCQFYVNDGKLDCQLYQRSGDMFLGVPFNVFSYTVLTMIMAKATGLKPGKFIHIIGDAHIYTDHIKQCEIQLKREPRPFPYLLIDERENFEEYTIDDFKLVNYECHDRIKAVMNV